MTPKHVVICQAGLEPGQAVCLVADAHGPHALLIACRLDLAESIRVPNRSGPRRNPFEVAMAEATRQEAQHGPPEELPFTATILCLGIAGTGKTATIHSLLGRPQPSNFAEGTKKVVLPGTRLGHLQCKVASKTCMLTSMWSI